MTTTGAGVIPPLKGRTVMNRETVAHLIVQPVRLKMYVVFRDSSAWGMTNFRADPEAASRWFTKA
jgi:hypothetical protein